MIPKLVNLAGSPWPVLPAGIHPASLHEVAQFFGTNTRRRELCKGLNDAAEALATTGCETLLLDGSFVTGKPIPGDYDAIWVPPKGLNPAKLDPVFLDFDNNRANQKAKYGGEFFPFGLEAAPGVAFISFFQTDRYTGKRKGMIEINLIQEPFNKGGGT